MSVTVHVVPHTHWDREWYHPAAVFGLRLTRLVDDLVDLLAHRPDFRTFLLDGQAVVLEDYLAARPEQESRLRRLFVDGRLEAGPWYVLADEFLVSPEALVRNLIEGARTVRRCGGRPMAVGYSPDAFGHPAGFPTILRGFGIEIAVLWRGLGGEPGQDGDLYRWRAPDGSEVLMVHLPAPGYENGQSLPAERAALAERWERLWAQLAPRARTPYWLVMAGADHHAAQHDLPEVIAALNAMVPQVRFALSPLEEYTSAVLAWARERGGKLPVIAGELRAGHRHAWALQGTHGSRLHLKQANAECQGLLERYAEPLAALETSRGGADRRAELMAAWRTLLENHPHDSICGTSADPVHREMTVRFDRCRQQGGEVVARAIEGAIGHDAVAARLAGRAAWKPALLVFNPAPARRDTVVEAEVALFEADVSVGQQRVPPAPPLRPDGFRLVLPDGQAVPFQELGARQGHDLVESPLRYPLSAAVEWRRVAVRLRDLPPLGVAALAVEPAVRARPAAEPAAGDGNPDDVAVAGNTMWNEHVAVIVEAAGTIEVVDRASGEHYAGLAALEDNGDVGDSYTYSAPRPDKVIREPDETAVRVVHAGPLRGVLEIARRYAAIALETVTRVTLDARSDVVEIEIEGENRRPDHRLRAAFPLGAAARREVADGLYGPVERHGVRAPADAGGRRAAGAHRPDAALRHRGRGVAGPHRLRHGPAGVRAAARRHRARHVASGLRADVARGHAGAARARRLADADPRRPVPRTVPRAARRPRARRPGAGRLRRHRARGRAVSRAAVGRDAPLAPRDAAPGVRAGAAWGWSGVLGDEARRDGAGHRAPLLQRAPESRGRRVAPALQAPVGAPRPARRVAARAARRRGGRPGAVRGRAAGRGDGADPLVGALAGERALQRVGQPAESQHHQRHRRGGGEAHPGRDQQGIAARRDHVAPRGRGRLHAEAEEGEAGLEHDGAADAEGRRHQGGRERVGQDVAEQHARGPVARGRARPRRRSAPRARAPRRAPAGPRSSSR